MWGPINHDAQICEKSLPYLGFVIYNCLIKNWEQLFNLYIPQ